MAPGRTVDFDSLAVGQSIGEQEVELSRSDLVRYSGASGDFNPIHYNDYFARNVGLPSVIAHGMLTMGLAASFVERWGGSIDPGSIVDYQTRFTKPVAVENAMGGGGFLMGPGAKLRISGVIGALDGAERTARIDLTVLSFSSDKPEGEKVLVKAQAVVVFPQQA